MKITILSVTSQFIHAPLAPWYLKAALSAHDVTVFETSINEPQEQTLAGVFATHPEMLCVPCYIWNIEYVQKLCATFKAALPDTKIVLGGPEVSFSPHRVLEECPWAWAVICGEGEEALFELCQNGEAEGAVVRTERGIQGDGTYRYVRDLSTIPSPYTAEMLTTLKNRLAYYESSRGCPFGCAYCLSSATHGVRYFPLERVKRELALISKAGVRTVKMVDRTFNANPARSNELLRFIIEETGDVCFHLEIGADLADADMLSLLACAPPGKIRLEAGVQSTNPAVLARAVRRTDMPRLMKNLENILSVGNVCVHADLIIGLPGEDMASFKKSFNDLYSLKPHELQLGFLKLLDGSALKRGEDLGGCVFSPKPPYTVLKTAEMSSEELFLMHEFEDAFEKFCNSGRFSRALDAAEAFFPTPFDLFMALSAFIRTRNLCYARLSASALYSIFADFMLSLGANSDFVADTLRLDYFSSVFAGRPPEAAAFDERRVKDACFEFLKTADIAALFPMQGDISPKALYKAVRFVPAFGKVYAFDPKERSKVSEKISAKILEISPQ